MTITALLMAGLLAFVLLVPSLMVAVLVSGIARRPQLAEADPAAEPAAVPAVVPAPLAVALPAVERPAIERPAVTRPAIELRAS